MYLAPGPFLILLLAFALPCAAQDTPAPSASGPFSSTAQDAPEPALDPTFPLRLEEPNHAELLALDARYAALRNERPTLVVPVLLATIGAGVTGISGLAAFMVWMVNVGSNYGDYEDGYFGEGTAAERDNPDRRAVLALTTLAAAGLPVALVGVIWMSKRLRARRPYNAEMNAIAIRRKQVLQNLRYGTSVHGESFTLSMTATF